MTSENNSPTLTVAADKLCNYCGLTCNLNGGYKSASHGLIDCTVRGGYASTPGNGEGGALDDCDSYTFSLCEFCLDHLFGEFKIPVVVDDYPDGKQPYVSAKERVIRDNWRGTKELFFKEFERRNQARTWKANESLRRLVDTLGGVKDSSDLAQPDMDITPKDFIAIFENSEDE